jgi:uncharacterized protein (DUF2267 family)
VTHDNFLSVVAQHAVGGREGAERASRAVLQTLGERIDREEARQLAAQLPPELAPWLATTTPAERFDADDFVGRVAQREGVDGAAAHLHVRAVFDALARAVSPDEWHDVTSELPRSFAALLPRGRYVEVPDGEALLKAVADRAEIDREAAQRAIDAVLETLAQRIAGGEVDDLIERLPIQFHDALARGRAATGGVARSMPLERFVQLIAEREAASLPDAVEHARAVLAVLRQAIGEEEFFDVVVQLPAEYVRTLV